MAALDVDDLITSIADDLRDPEDGRDRSTARAVRWIEGYAGVPEHLLERRSGPADKSGLHTLPYEAGKEFTQEFLTAAPPAEIVDEKNVHLILHDAESKERKYSLPPDQLLLPFSMPS